MALNYQELMARSETDIPLSYSDSVTMLYALCVGMGRDPLHRKELPYVYEQGGAPSTVPTLATVLVPDMFPKDLGWDYSQVLHSEQRMRLYRPLPAAADLLINKRVVDAFDRGSTRGALILLEAEGRLASDDTVLFTLGCTIVARGDGGFGGPSGKGPAPHRAPRREPDLSCDLETRRDQALLYRLNGDRNPLHADPGLATRVGFPVPILHGLCTYGVACHAIGCGQRSRRVRALTSGTGVSIGLYPGRTSQSGRIGCRLQLGARCNKIAQVDRKGHQRDQRDQQHDSKNSNRSPSLVVGVIGLTH